MTWGIMSILGQLATCTLRKQHELGIYLPTTKQVVGNGHLQTDLDGKNKKALYLQANNRASKTFLDG